MSMTHCWTGYQEYVEDRYGWGSDEWAKAFNEPSATCMLEHGHTGPHVFTPDDEIGVKFPEEEDR